MQSAAIETNIGNFTRQKNCAKLPQFLERLKISGQVMIDLSQKRFKGIALHYGKNFTKTLHPKIWEQYDHFSTYALTERGDIYLTPSPFISIGPTTFNLQKNLFILDSRTGKLAIWKQFDDVRPSPYNPYGINSVAYDCHEKTLWVGAIDETSYEKQRGVIYRVDIATKKILQTIEGTDAMTLRLLKTDKGKYLLVGSARESSLYACEIKNGTGVTCRQKILTLPDPNQRIRKIRVKGKNHLLLETIPFSYTLIAQASQEYRIKYDAVWNSEKNQWHIRRYK